MLAKCRWISIPYISRGQSENHGGKSPFLPPVLSPGSYRYIHVHVAWLLVDCVHSAGP